MARLSTVRTVAPLLAALQVFVACASIRYHSEPVVSESRYTMIENFSTEVITPEQVDDLLAEIAQILGVQLDAARPKARIIVTTPSRITELYRATTVVAPHGADAAGLYFPGASLVMVSTFDRRILGHELAHYLTDHYLKQIPRDSWEAVAGVVERRLPSTPAARPTVPPILVAHTAPSPRASE